MSNWFIGTIILFCSFNIFGKTNLNITGDSLHYLTTKDTIFLSSDYEGQKIFIHTMEPKQTLYSLSKFYGLSLDELYYYNPANEGGKYGIGSEIKIPIPNRSIIRYKPKDYSNTSYIPLYYVVKKGETMYHIAQRVFKLPIDTLMDRNFLPNPTLSVGQKLRIGWMSINGIPESYRATGGKHPLWMKSRNYERKYRIAKTKKREYRRNGPAVYIQDIKSATDLWVMHRHAPIGSIIQINNPMKRRTLYAKVIARMPRTYDANIEIVVSPRVGKMLGAIDKKFYVKTRYLR